MLILLLLYIIIFYTTINSLVRQALYIITVRKKQEKMCVNANVNYILNQYDNLL